jgi:dihydrofolate synthase/folylpolyglutamate synthase
LLGHPERTLRCVQIAGTNGKGTVAALLAHAAASAGLKVGLFTSPHLHRFAERIRIDGKECDQFLLVDHLDRVLKLSQEHPDLALTFFELATLTALSVFESQKVDLAVLEVGLGGRLDATSIVDPVATAITSIGLDHTSILGDTLGEIAREKAAIARPGVPLLVGAVEEEPRRVIRECAEKKGALIRELGRDFHIPRDVKPPWPGEHQRSNLAVASALFRFLCKADPRLNDRVFADALDTISWPGRFERLEMGVQYILDCAHNLEATRALVDALKQSHTRPDSLIFGALKDKPAEAMLAHLRPAVGQIVLVPPPIDRGREPGTLTKAGDIVCETVAEGLQRALEITPAAGAILVTGSIFTVGAARALLLNESMDPPIGL